MSNINDGGAAFPIPPESMFLRDWFAGMALANPYTNSETDPNKIGEWAYQIADAMLKAREVQS